MGYFKRRNEALVTIAASAHYVLSRFDKFFDDVNDIRLHLRGIEMALTERIDKLEEEVKGGIALKNLIDKPCVCGHPRLHHNLLGNCQECNCEVYHLTEVIE